MTIPNELMIMIYDFCDKPTRININRAYNWNYYCINPYKDYILDKRCINNNVEYWGYYNYKHCSKNFNKNSQCIKCRNFYCNTCMEDKDGTLLLQYACLDKICYDCQQMYFASKEWNLILLDHMLYNIVKCATIGEPLRSYVKRIIKYVKHSVIFINRFNEDTAVKIVIDGVQTETLTKIKKFLELEVLNKEEKVQLINLISLKSEFSNKKVKIARCQFLMKY